MNIKYIAPDFFPRLNFVTNVVFRDVSFEGVPRLFSPGRQPGTTIATVAFSPEGEAKGGWGVRKGRSARNEERGNKREECSTITIDTLVRG